MGAWHARYAARAGARVVAVADPRPGAAPGLQREFPAARAVADLRECLDGADVVHVCTPPETHVELIEAALGADRHVLVEKPLATSAADARRLVDLARARGLLLSPVHQLPFQRGVRRIVRERARLGELVRLAYVTCSAGGDGLAPEGRRALLLEILPHPLSLFRALLGTGPAPQAWTQLDFTCDELALSASDGRTRLDLAISLRARPRRNELTVTGSAASAHADLFHGFATFESGAASRADKLTAPFRQGAARLAAAAANLAWRGLRREPAYPGLPELIAAFYAAVRAGGPPPVTPEETIETAALIEHVAGRS